MREPVITVVGSNMIDLITNIDRMPRKGETLEASYFDMGFGGKGANQAVAASLLGANVTIVTRVGDDIFGNEVKKNLEEFGIDTSFVEKAKGVSNGVAPILVDPKGNNYILIVKGANSYISDEDVKKAENRIKESDIVILQLEIPVETVYYTIEFCKSLGVPVILNPAPGISLNFNIIRKVDILIPNETELEIISGLPVRSIDEATEAALSLIEKGIRRVIVTMGEKGALLVDGKNIVHIPSIEVTPRDTTGAGDAFIGSFSYYYIKKNDIIKAINYANHYAALSTLKVGTQKSFLTKEEFEKNVII